MRLSALEVRAIRDCAARHFGDGCKVRLFGSRVDDARRGGDIDLHIESIDDRTASLEAELGFKADLADLLGEERIDVIVRRPGYVPRTIDLIAQRTGIAI